MNIAICVPEAPAHRPLLTRQLACARPLLPLGQAAGHARDGQRQQRRHVPRDSANWEQPELHERRWKRPRLGSSDGQPHTPGTEMGGGMMMPVRQIKLHCDCCGVSLKREEGEQDTSEGVRT